jgi:uncharacterized alkaline shock family protein YloU
MTETSAGPTESTTASGTGSATGSPRGSGGRLATDKGTTTIADVVVTKVAGIAAREVGGVHALGGAVARALGAVTQRLQVSDSNTQGVSVEVTDAEAKVSITVIVDYGESIPDVAQEIRDNIIRRLQAITGLTVVAVDVAVTDLYFPGDDDDSADA